MKYVPPIGATDPNAPYITENLAAGIEGSPVAAEAIEHPMREILAVITEAGLTPNEENLGQLLAAIGVLITEGMPTINAATTETPGIVELATDAEATTGTDTTRCVTPKQLKAVRDMIPAAGFANMSVFTASGSFVVPAGVTRVFVEVWGGGGGGGTGGATNCAGGGGGGGYAAKIVTGLTPGNTISVTVGNGGSRASSAGGTGGSGGSSSFGAHCSATGGSGGVGGNGGSTVSGGAPGAGVGGNLNVSGQPGGAGADTSIDYFGEGGGSYKHPGGALRVSQSVAMAGYDAPNPGCGGGGGSSTTGGAGAAGQVIVWY